MDLDLPMPLEAVEAPIPVRSFREIVTAHQSLVFSIALHTLRNKALAEEVAQEVFLRLSSRLGAVKSEEHLVNWLRTVTSRLCIDELRHHDRKASSLEVVAEPAVEPQPKDPFLSAHLRRLVGELPPPMRVALVLRYQEDLDPSDIARILQEPLPTIKSRLQRGLQNLRDGLRTMGVGDERP